MSSARIVCFSGLAAALVIGTILASGCARGDTALSEPDSGAIDTEAPDAGGDAMPRDAGATDATSVPTRRCDPTKPFGPPVAHAELASNAHDSDARLTSDERIVFFRSERIGPSGGSGDIWTSSRASASGAFSAPAQVTAVNGADYDFSPSVTDDLLTMYLVRGAAKIFRATRPSAVSPFGSPVEVPGLYADGMDTQAYVLPSGKRLYFVSTRSSLGTGGQPSIVVSNMDGSSVVPSRVSELDSSGPSFPVVSSDELTIYFGSARSDGGAQGERDVWMAHRKQTTEPFGAPVNVTELNSASDDVPSWVSPDGCVLYVSSTRDGAVHRIYEAKRPL